MLTSGYKIRINTSMTFDYTRDLDEKDWAILNRLETSARTTVKTLSEAVGLSSPAVTERIRRLEDDGVILGYRAVVNPAKVGLPLLVIIRLDTPAQRYKEVLDLLRSMRGVVECHHVSGADSFVIKGHYSSVTHLEDVIGQLSKFGRTASSVVMSSPINEATLARSKK
jgi:Lrp/AsnC family transcriptional regulator, leucine-responsive regulatory protein